MNGDSGKGDGLRSDGASRASHASPPEAAIDPRVIFAAERTLLAWIRTGLSLMGFGFVVARFGLFLRELVAAQQHTATPSSPGFSLWIGTALVILGVIVNIVAVQHHVKIIGRLNRGETIYATAASPGTIFAITLALLGVIIAAYLFTLGR